MNSGNVGHQLIAKHKVLLLGQDVERFEKLSLGRLGKPEGLRAGDEQLIGKALERLL